MRRKSVEIGGGVPSRLRVEALPVFVDDLELSVAKRVVLFDEWETAFNVWRAERAAWASVNGWPEGEDQRLLEEQQVIPLAAPFDASTI